MLGTFRLCGLLIFAVACKTPSVDPAPTLASATRASATPSATATSASSGAASASSLPPAPPAAPPPSASVERADPLDHKSPFVRESQRDSSVKLCCDMFGPYVTGCVAVSERCYGDIQSYCQEAWKRGAHLGDIELGIRKLVQKDRYYMPKPCVAPPPSGTP